MLTRAMGGGDDARQIASEWVQAVTLPCIRDEWIRECVRIKTQLVDLGHMSTLPLPISSISQEASAVSLEEFALMYRQAANGVRESVDEKTSPATLAEMDGRASEALLKQAALLAEPIAATEYNVAHERLDTILHAVNSIPNPPMLPDIFSSFMGVDKRNEFRRASAQFHASIQELAKRFQQARPTADSQGAQFDARAWMSIRALQQCIHERVRRSPQDLDEEAISHLHRHVPTELQQQVEDRLGPVRETQRQTLDAAIAAYDGFITTYQATLFGIRDTLVSRCQAAAESNRPCVAFLGYTPSPAAWPPPDPTSDPPFAVPPLCSAPVCEFVQRFSIPDTHFADHGTVVLHGCATRTPADVAFLLLRIRNEAYTCGLVRNYCQWMTLLDRLVRLYLPPRTLFG
jgi:hypothetical protein